MKTKFYWWLFALNIALAIFGFIAYIAGASLNWYAIPFSIGLGLPFLQFFIYWIYGEKL